jgi:NADPH:quinone reductase
MNLAPHVPESITTDALRVGRAMTPGDLTLPIESVTVARPRGNAVIEIAAAGVNASDVKAALGTMPHAVWPRTPGRDYCGVVIEGPADLIGKEVWGSGGELGIRRDGTHARHLVIDASYIRAKPSTLSLQEAGAVGVPFITAYEGLREAGGVQVGDVVLVLGGNGKVGQAAIQLATMAGAAQVFGVEREAEPFLGHATGPVEMLDASAIDAADHILQKTGGHGADIIFNTVGSPYFEVANRAMAVKGRQIFVSTIEHSVPFDIFAFYRGRHKFVGIDTLAIDSGECAAILDDLRAGFESGSLKPFQVHDDHVYPLGRAVEAYQAVLAGSRERIVLDPRA